jgi:hypothetical protein
MHTKNVGALFEVGEGVFLPEPPGAAGGRRKWSAIGAAVPLGFEPLCVVRPTDD